MVDRYWVMLSFENLHEVRNSSAKKALKPTWYKVIVLVNLGYVLECPESIHLSTTRQVAW